VSDEYALVAFQGPLAAEILQPLTNINLESIKRYHFAAGNVADCPDCIIARTGYTGEDGFEIFCNPSCASGIWTTILEEGMPRGVKPTGLGARDTLRMEMKYSLYGHEITEDTNPFEAGLNWVVKMDKAGDFIGKEALISAKNSGQSRILVGFKMLDKSIPREGYSIVSNGKEVGVVTSGTKSPSLGESIGIGFVPPALSKTGSKFAIDIRGTLREAEVVKTPFYKR
jgi:aminomethyltransferase